MKKLLLFSRDPGGANVLIPLIKRMQSEYDLLVYAKDYAISCMCRENISCINIMDCIEQCTETEIFSFLQKLQVDGIISGTSLDDYTERYLWKAAERLQIPSFVILDQWINLGIRFSKYDYMGQELYKKNPEHSYLPYRIFVMDEMAKKMLLDEGIEEHKICVTGQPHFDEVIQKYNQVNTPELDESVWNVLFVSEPISENYENMYFGYDELTIFHNLYQVLGKISKQIDKKIQLIIRPHPRDSLKKWEQIINELSSESISIKYDTNTESIVLLKQTQVVCGMSSMFLLEAALCRIPIISIQIGLVRLSPFVLDRIGLCKSVYSLVELEKRLLEINNKTTKEIQFPIIQNATENCLECIKEIIEHG